MLEREAWQRYLSWNAALAGSWFSVDNAGLPAYLDVEPAVVGNAAETAGLDAGKDPVATLAKIVSQTVWLGGGSPLNYQAGRLRAWRSSARQASLRHQLASDPPPVVALLGAFTIAAYRMRADGKHHANAYFPRLFELLEVAESDRARMTSAFRRLSENLWHGLNEYLTQHEGQLGIPTAYALGHRFVGLPQSQALIRASDRRKLTGFFRAFGLAPGSEVVPGDLERLLDLWIMQKPAPVTINLQQLWRGTARKRIAGVVAVELSHWDGSLRDAQFEGLPRKGDLSLTALVRRRLGAARLELSFAARFPDPVEADVLRVVSAENAPTIAVMPAVGGRVRPAPASRIDSASLVGAKVEVEDEATGQHVQRLPRRVVPLHKDELLGLYVETERIQLAEDALVLVKDESALVDAVTSLLRSCGRYASAFANKGREGVDPLPNLPDGWLLLSGVQLFAIPQGGGRVELDALSPLTSSQLTLTGGLKLPGRVRKWSSLCPPEIRAVATGDAGDAGDAGDLTVSLRPLDDEAAADVEGLSWPATNGVVVAPLQDLALEDGDYEVVLTQGSTQLAQSTLRLRSADTPDLISWATCTRLVYELDLHQDAPISASPMSGNSDLLVDGPHVIGGGDAPQSTRRLPGRPSWLTAPRKDNVVSRPVVLGHNDPNSCLLTGAHHMRLPTAMGGTQSGHIDGVCQGCGLVKRYPVRPKKKVKQAAPAKAWSIDLSWAPPQLDLDIDADTCMDALIHVGGGTRASFERVATQADGSSLFVDDLLCTLEVVGHVDVRRDSRCQPVEWEVTPQHLAELPDGRFLLTGAWSATLRADLGRLVSARGGRLEALQVRRLITSWVVAHLDQVTLEEIIGDLGATVAPNAAWRLLCALPPLGTVEGALTEVDIPSFTKVERFDVASAAWVPVPGVVGPGAFRLEQSFRSVCLWVNAHNATIRRGRIAPPQLVKHLAARAAGKPLMAHLAQSDTLVVPLGADLPGLYGRVASLCSGTPPVQSPQTRSLAYQDVPKPVADGLAGLMTN